MKKLALIAALLLGATSTAVAQNITNQDYGLPELHVIKTVALAPTYSCRSQEEFQKGYQGTALFLSDYSRRRNSPELLFNGACRSADYFEALGAGFDMSLIVDLGAELQLENLTAQDVFHIYYQRSSLTSPDTKQTPSALRQDVKVVPDHTYAVFLNKSEIRGLLVFTVTKHIPSQQVELKYAVKDYQIIDVRAQSSGFNWEQTNSAAQTNPLVEKTQSKKQN
ncbi:MAG: hypothetical protein QOH25_3117 [Acidobacteriota bacterium]|jgi:hypothetical protein|nr:hypothetical protein [Acidobacteriota bacterium]